MSLFRLSEFEHRHIAKYCHSVFEECSWSVACSANPAFFLHFYQICSQKKPPGRNEILGICSCNDSLTVWHCHGHSGQVSNTSTTSQHPTDFYLLLVCSSVFCVLHDEQGCFVNDFLCRPWKGNHIIRIKLEIAGKAKNNRVMITLWFSKEFVHASPPRLGDGLRHWTRMERLESLFRSFHLELWFHNSEPGHAQTSVFSFSGR